MPSSVPKLRCCTVGADVGTVLLVAGPPQGNAYRGQALGADLLSRPFLCLSPQQTEIKFDLVSAVDELAAQVGLQGCRCFLPSGTNVWQQVTGVSVLAAWHTPNLHRLFADQAGV